METTMTIGEVANAAGINASAIRYYERSGVLPEPQRIGSQRRYDADIVRRLSILHVAKRAGFTLDDVRLLFEATDAGAPAHAELRALAQAKLPQIEALITQTQEVKRWLETSSRCTCDTLDECSLFESTSPVEASCGPECGCS